MQNTTTEEAAKVAAIASTISGGSDAILFGGVWAIAVVSAIARFTSDNNFRNCTRLIAGSASAGFLAFSVVAVLRYYLRWDGNTDMLCLGVAALIGGLGKEQEKLRMWAVNKVFGIEGKEEK